MSGAAGCPSRCLAHAHESPHHRHDDRHLRRRATDHARRDRDQPRSDRGDRYDRRSGAGLSGLRPHGGALARGAARLHQRAYPHGADRAARHGRGLGRRDHLPLHVAGLLHDERSRARRHGGARLPGGDPQRHDDAGRSVSPRRHLCGRDGGYRRAALALGKLRRHRHAQDPLRRLRGRRGFRADLPRPHRSADPGVARRARRAA